MRRNFSLLLVLVAWALLMSTAARFTLPQPAPVQGISGTGLILEFAQNPQQVDDAFKPGKIADYRTAVIVQQALDVVLIGLYWSVFYFVLAGPLYSSTHKPWHRLGLAARILVSFAAVFDLLEDYGIVSVLHVRDLPVVWPFWFSVIKWTLLFAMLAVVARGLIFRSKLVPLDHPRPAWLERLAFGSASLYYAAAFCGIAGVIGRLFGCGELLLPGAALMALGSLTLLGVLAGELSGKKAPLTEKEEPEADQAASVASKTDANKQTPAAVRKVSEVTSALSFKDILKEELKEVSATAEFRKGFPAYSGTREYTADMADPVRRFPARDRAPIPVPELKDEHGSAIQEAGRRGLLGLAFSGGGIRSATFNLGVLQGLAEHRFLRRFHYLSTVSGGGYIGSWLAGWIYRQGMEEVEKRLREPRTNQPNFKEPPEIRFLREYSNYLTPRTGLFGADTWTAIATYLRNLLLNQSILVLFIAAALVLPRLVLIAADSCALWFAPPCHPIVGLLVAFAVLATIAIARNMAYYDSGQIKDRVLARVREGAPDGKSLKQLKVDWLFGDSEHPEVRAHLLAKVGRVEVWDQNLVRRREVGHATRLSSFDANGDILELDMEVSGVMKNDLVMAVYPWTARQAGIFSLITLPLFIGVSLLTWLLAKSRGADQPHYWPWFLSGAGVAAVCWLLGAAIVWFRALNKKIAWLKASTRFVASLIAGALSGILLKQVASLLQGWMRADKTGDWNVIAFGVPLVALAFLAFSVVQVGLSGTFMFEPRREWIGRLEAWFLILSVGWAAIFSLAGYSPLLVIWLSQSKIFSWTTIVGWAGSTLSGVLGGSSAKTSGFESTVKDKLLGLTPYVFAAGLLVMVSAGVTRVVSGPIDLAAKTSEKQVTVPMAEASAQDVNVRLQAVVKKDEKSSLQLDQYWPQFFRATNNSVWLAFLICFLGSLVLANRVDLNGFSMHNFYRNRLVRCYLGASHRERVPNPFTGFDEGDDVFLAKLTANNGYDGPYPILNCALNLVHGKDLAWQERKAASFIMTPQHCGYDVWYEKLLRPGQWEKRGQQSNGYRPTANYAYPDGGFYIGTAMSISGAAASPNMGFHTSPALAFLMTVFNVRLGQWVGNPRDPRSWKRAGPWLGLGYLLSELFGSTDDDSGYVYLSDGGHFENLGLYELVKRRCRFILASDAGEDKNLAFDDLASAIRKIRADMGIDIEIKTDKIIKVGTSPFSCWHCAIGLIKYTQSDPPLKKPPAGDPNKVEDGILVYIKPSLTSDESADVLNYKAHHPDFPHQPTADQWFTESQFESYRALGQHVVQTLFFSDPDTSPQDLSQISLAELIERLTEDWKNSEEIHTNRGVCDC